MGRDNKKVAWVRKRASTKEQEIAELKKAEEERAREAQAKKEAAMESSKKIG